MKLGENIVNSLLYKPAKFGTPNLSRSEGITKHFGSLNYAPPCSGASVELRVRACNVIYTKYERFDNSKSSHVYRICRP